MTPSVFITGGGGFIGAHLAERLVAKGQSVTIFDNFHPQLAGLNVENAARLKQHGVRVVEGDVCDRDAVGAALSAARPDVVYHLAAETGTGQSYDHPARYAHVNVTGTAQLVEAMRTLSNPVERVILTSSRAVYGEGAYVDGSGAPSLPVPRTQKDMAAGDFDPKDVRGQRLTPVATNAQCPPRPASVYASTKLMQEYLLSQTLTDSETELGVLRLHNVYGPGQSLNNPYAGVLSLFARQILDGKALEVFEDGHITRDFVFIDDVVTALERMGEIDVMPSDPIDIGTGRPSTILDVATELLRLMGRDDTSLTVTGAFRPGDIRHALADTSAAQDRLGWRAEHDLTTGLDRLIGWSQTHQTKTI